jgi:hypothetical protein
MRYRCGAKADRQSALAAKTSSALDLPEMFYRFLPAKPMRLCVLTLHSWAYKAYLGNTPQNYAGACNKAILDLDRLSFTCRERANGVPRSEFYAGLRLRPEQCYWVQQPQMDTKSVSIHVLDWPPNQDKSGRY